MIGQNLFSLSLRKWDMTLLEDLGELNLNNEYLRLEAFILGKGVCLVGYLVLDHGVFLVRTRQRIELSVILPSTLPISCTNH